MERKRCMKTVLVQFGVLPTGSKIITSATRDAQGSNHLFVYFFFLYRLSCCLALWIGMTQTTSRGYHDLSPGFVKYTSVCTAQSSLKPKGNIIISLMYRGSAEVQTYPSFRGLFFHLFSGTKSRILQRKISF